MQKKINYIIWGFVFVLIVFFTILTFINSNKIKEFKFSDTKPYNIDVRIYSDSNKTGDDIIKKVKAIKKDSNSMNYLNSIIKVVKGNKIDKYLIMIDDDVIVGDHYSNDLYKVATFYPDNSLFKIFEVENKLVLTEDYDDENYDRIIMVGDIDKVNKTYQLLEKVSISDMLRSKNGNDIELYFIKDNKLVGSNKS